jgi:TRAP-type mannitol/chloroaromatic compound transport system substrate-binding protein
MRRRVVIIGREYNMKSLIAAAVVGLSMLAMSGTETSAQNVRLNMGSTFPSGMVQLGGLGKRLETASKAVSGGTLELRFFEPGALVPALELFDAVSNGSVDAAWSTPGYWQGKEPALALFSAIPFGPEAGEYAAWLFHFGGEKQMQEIYAKHNVHSMICGVIAPEASGWFREEITSIDQLQGLKMRFFGLGAKVMQKLGVDTQLLAGGDIFPALERGTIDATEFSMPAIDLGLGFHQVAKHYYFPGWHQMSTTFELMIHKPTWDALSDQHKAMLEIICRANYADGLAEGEAIQAAALKELEAAGVQFHRWDAEVLGTLETTWLEVAEEIAASDKAFKESWESLQAFRADYKRWRELGYLN